MGFLFLVTDLSLILEVGREAEGRRTAERMTEEAEIRALREQGDARSIRGQLNKAELALTRINTANEASVKADRMVFLFLVTDLSLILEVANKARSAREASDVAAKAI